MGRDLLRTVEAASSPNFHSVTNPTSRVAAVEGSRCVAASQRDAVLCTLVKHVCC